MKKKLAWLLWLPLSAVSPLALAVGLGQATVNSPLQSPLDASVPLVDAADVPLEEVRVEIADQSAFSALGLEWTPLAASVRTELQRLPSGARLVLRSDQAVNEPWLDLLITITTPEGQHTEALMLLFDPPNYAANADATVSDTPSVAQSALPQPVPERHITYIASGDTLWSVAERIKPADVSVQQMMMALVEANPAAFPTGDVDDMQAGQTLRVPSHEKVMALTPTQAAQAVQAMRQPSSVASSVNEAQTADEEAEQSAGSDGSDSEAAPSQTPSADVAPEGMVQENELAGLTLSDLAEQLQESQAMLQIVLEEREQMRADMAALRQEVASLTEALHASQREAQRALAAAEPLQTNDVAPANTAVNTSSSPSLVERLEAYQWPLASVALALLLGGLVWSRKRRERQWEDVSSSAGFETPPPQRPEPSVSAATAGESGVPLGEVPLSEAAAAEEDRPRQAPPTAGVYNKEPESYDEAGDFMAKEPLASRHDEPHRDTQFSLVEEAEAPGPQSAAGTDHKNGTAWDMQDEASGEGKAGTADTAATDEAASPPEEEEAALRAAFLETPEPVEEPASQAHISEAEEPLPAVAEDEAYRAHYIDYHPPSLTNDFGTTDEDAASESAAESKSARTSRPRRVPEEEWEIEEVAFEPRRRDNS
ncbi:FimV family protein [Vreelandella aquamarina]|uniref:type IV pilus assembly protein FimV n=1 Tax=Vreelandella aquamarina TaxID=77097 RepID=UPI003850DDB5